MQESLCPVAEAATGFRWPARRDSGQLLRTLVASYDWMDLRADRDGLQPVRGSGVIIPTVRQPKASQTTENTRCYSRPLRLARNNTGLGIMPEIVGSAIAANCATTTHRGSDSRWCSGRWIGSQDPRWEAVDWMDPLAPLAVGRIEIQLAEPTPSDVEFFLGEQWPEHRLQNNTLKRQV